MTTQTIDADLLSGMLIFAAVVEAGSFTRAAERLTISKGTVSKALARLEDRLGVHLMNRTTRKLSITEAGQGFYEHCARLIAEAEQAERSVTSHQLSPRGLLRISAPVSFGIMHLSPALAEFQRRYPDIQLELSLNDRMVDLLEEGFDMAVRIGALADSSLMARRVAYSRAVVAASPDYLTRRGTPTHPRDLADHSCLIYTYSRHPREWDFEVDGEALRVSVDGALAANNGNILVAAAIAGQGVTMTPSFLCWQALASGELVELLSGTTPVFSAYAIYPQSRHVSSKVRAFIDFLVEHFGPVPYWEQPAPPSL